MKQRGFTIVEIIIVLIVLGILATIGGLAWHKAQQNAIDNKAKTDALILRDAIERYYADNGEYPWPLATCEKQGSYWSHCFNNQLGAVLIPKYIKEMPVDHRGKAFQYATDSARRLPGSIDRYGILVQLSDKRCKTGKNMGSSWWAYDEVCDF